MDMMRDRRANEGRHAVHGHGPLDSGTCRYLCISLIITPIHSTASEKHSTWD